MYEELQIVRDSEAQEDNLKKRVKELGKTVEEANQLVLRKEAELVKRTKAVQKANAQLKTIQEMIENELADNKHCEYLLKVFMMRDTNKNKKTALKEKSVAASASSTGKQFLKKIQGDPIRHPELVNLYSSSPNQQPLIFCLLSK